MKAYLATFVVVFSLSLTACGNVVRPKDPENFVAFTSNTYYELDSDLKYTERRGIGVLWEEGLKAGRYVAKFQDESGYYFVGPDSSVCQATPACKEFSMNGGIWISKESPDDIRIFAITNPSSAEKDAHGDFGPVVQLMIMSGYGKARFFPLNQQFSERIKSSARTD